MFDKLKSSILLRRGNLQVDTEKCNYCGKCQHKCPVNAIVVSASSKGWHVNNEKCLRCGRCLRECSSFALSIEKN